MVQVVTYTSEVFKWLVVTLFGWDQLPVLKVTKGHKVLKEVKVLKV
jgi:hypothetical protein